MHGELGIDWVHAHFRTRTIHHCTKVEHPCCWWPAEKVTPNTSHGEADQEVAEPARRLTHITKGAVFHAWEHIRTLATAFLRSRLETSIRSIGRTKTGQISSALLEFTSVRSLG